MRFPRYIWVATIMWGVFLCHCKDPDLSGDVAILGVIYHDMWTLLRHFIPRNDG